MNNGDQMGEAGFGAYRFEGMLCLLVTFAVFSAMINDITLSVLPQAGCLQS